MNTSLLEYASDESKHTQKVLIFLSSHKAGKKWFIHDQKQLSQKYICGTHTHTPLQENDTITAPSVTDIHKHFVQTKASELTYIDVHFVQTKASELTYIHVHFVQTKASEQKENKHSVTAADESDLYAFGNNSFVSVVFFLQCIQIKIETVLKWEWGWGEQSKKSITKTLLICSKATSVS